MNIGFKDSIKPIDADKDLYEGVFNEVVYLFHLIGEHLVINNNLVLLSKSSQGV